MADGFVGFSLAVHFAKVGTARGAPASPGPTSPVASRMQAWRAKIAHIGAEVWETIFIRKSATASTIVKPGLTIASSVAPGKKRVVPTVEKDAC